MGYVYNIQRFSLADGPSVRTTVFMSECSLSCKWCHNPEGQHKQALQYLKSKCICCGACKEVCGYNVHSFDNEHIVNFSKCSLCGKCVEVCPAEALKIVGENYGAQELAEELLKDLPYFSNGGGITFSGGEPLLQAAFVAEVSEICKKRGVPTVAIDTAGFVNWKCFEKVLPNADIFLYDIKAMDEDLHRKYTNHGNRQILENLLRLDRQNKRIWIRVPVIKGFNANDTEMKRIADFTNELKSVERVTLIPFHTLGQEKYATVGMKSDMDEFDTLSNKELEEYYKFFKDTER